MPLSVLLRVALTQVSLFIQIVQDQKYITVTVVLDSISSHILGHQPRFYHSLQTLDLR